MLTRQSRRFGGVGVRFLLLSVPLLAAGLVLFFLGSGWVFAIGLACIAFGAMPVVVATALFLVAIVSDWAGHRRSFA